MKKILVVLALLTASALGADFRIQTSGNYNRILGGRAWSDINNNYIFRPIDPRISLYIFVRNNNPTNSHTLTIAVSQTPDPQVADYSNNTKSWVNDIVSGDCTTVAANSMATCWVGTMFSAQVSIRISGAATAAGSPDSVDIFIVQAVADPKGQTPGGGSSSVTINPWIATYTLDYDSGITVVPNANTALTASTVAVTNFYCANVTGAAATLTVTNTAGVNYITAFSIPANSTVQFIQGGKGVPMAGIKWLTGTASAINCQVTGYR